MLFQFQNKAARLNDLETLKSKKSFSVVYCSFFTNSDPVDSFHEVEK